VLPQIQPAKLARSLAAFNDPDWLFELKHDGTDLTSVTGAIIAKARR